jgi:PGF-CTERM protein
MEKCMSDETRTSSSGRWIALAVVGIALAGVVAAIAVAPAAANHGDDAGNYTIVLPEPSDHLPGDQNEANASMQNFASAGVRFEQEGAPNGFEKLKYLETGTPEIDYSTCNSENTAVFGVDRGNNNSGTQTDTSLLEHMKDSRFKENKIEVDFYDESDIGGDPTYLNPEDAIVSVQGSGSSDGPCFTMPTEPGWYQVEGMVRGITEDGETVEVESTSHYFPICEGCHDPALAELLLGKPPSQRDDSDGSTATPTASPTATPDEGDDGSQDTPEDTPTPDDTSNDGDDGSDDGSGSDGSDDSDDGSGSDDGSDGGQNDADGSGSNGGGNPTPSPGEGPGFGPLAALLALLATALLANRRR